MNPWEIPYWDITLRLVLAVILGGLIGWERERNNHPAGFRTHILVCLGSGLITLISMYAFSDFMHEPNVRFDPSRVCAQVVSGIGFLGAGTILRHGISVTGLTTAASLWVVSGIGIAVGTGFTYGAILATVLGLVSLELLNRFDSFFAKKSMKVVRMVVTDEPGILGELASLIASHGASIRKVNIDEGEMENHLIDLTFVVRLPEKMSITDLMAEIHKVKGVKSIRNE